MKHVLVVGMGMSGIAAAEALRSAGEAVDTYDKKQNPDFPAVTDEKGRPVYDQLVGSPGVPLNLPFIEEAKAAGSEIIGELELAYRMGSGTYYAITGTNGKTTTTTLTGEIFKAAGRPTEVVGNIGVSVISKSVGCAPDTCLVTECSSFQLDTTVDFRPHIAAVLNLSPDHLDRHGTAENYYQAKLKIAKNQGPDDFFVYNADDPETRAHVRTLATEAHLVPFSRTKELPYGVFVRDGMIVCRTMPCAGSANEAGFDEFCEVPVLRADEVYIPGDHNLENALAATAVAFFAGISPDVIAETLRTFRGVEHRLEYAGHIDDIRFVNDSKGTNPDAAIKALRAT
ncbi:MAG: UDP-N-acetylmuramoyl-L-alanine--D-glutamate ligase, partial [Firmicutes bacterium]|nr:UDP-N-acetylmuramoyl-L-alanine--D-glutamate ligase [Bacillota bacterium]